MGDEVLLYGQLEVAIRSARNLPDKEWRISKLWNSGDVTDPYVQVRLGRARMVKTRLVLE